MSGIGVKHKYSTSHKTITIATKKGNQMLMELIDCTHETNLVLEEKRSKFQESNLETQMIASNANTN
jgi:hypothetical protein